MACAKQGCRTVDGLQSSELSGAGSGDREGLDRIAAVIEGQLPRQPRLLIGVAPYAFDSGKLKGARCIWGGRAL
jgi:hypothetical protein